MTGFYAKWLACLKDRSGVSAVEYAFIAALICLVIVLSLEALGVEVESLLNSAVEAFGSSEEE